MSSLKGLWIVFIMCRYKHFVANATETDSDYLIYLKMKINVIQKLSAGRYDMFIING